MACVVYECKSHSSNKSEDDKRLTFHRFPQDEELKNVWIKAISRKNWEPSQYSRICSKHFTKESYVEGRKRNLLKRNAVPTVFENYPSYIQKECTELVKNHLMEVKRHTSLKIRQTQKTLAFDQSSTSKGIEIIAALTKQSESTKVMENHLMEVRRHTGLKIRQTQKALALNHPSTSKELRIKKIASLTKQLVGDTPERIKLKRVLAKQFKLSSTRLKKLKTIQQKCRRYKRTIISLQNEIEELRSEILINNECGQVLSNIGTENEDYLNIYFGNVSS